MNNIRPFYLRLKALTIKESHQLLRDKSSWLIGLILPLVLILLFGYGLSFDLTNGRVGLVIQKETPQSRQLVSGLNGTTDLNITQYNHFRDAEMAMGRSEIDAIVQLPNDFAQQVANGNAVVQVITNGRNTNIATTIHRYIVGALFKAQAIEKDRHNHAIQKGLYNNRTAHVVQ